MKIPKENIIIFPTWAFSNMETQDLREDVFYFKAVHKARRGQMIKNPLR